MVVDVIVVNVVVADVAINDEGWVDGATVDRAAKIDVEETIGATDRVIFPVDPNGTGFWNGVVCLTGIVACC